MKEEVLKEIKEKSQRSPSILNKLENLSLNPHSICIPTGIPQIGNYYVNAGRYCILFDIDDNNKVVHIHSIYLSAKLHKILTNRI